MKIIKRVLLSIVLILAVAGAGFAVWGSTPMQPMPEAVQALKPSAAVDVRVSPWLEFAPVGKPAAAGLILYPGARVDPRAYAPMARAIAEQGYLVAIPAMPLNFAIFGGDKAAEIIAAHPEIQQWALGGHSLGGVMAASFSKNHLDRVHGLVLLASYPMESDDLTTSGLKVTSIFASNDGLATPEKIDASRPLLPVDTDWVDLIGGNHAQFGWYGVQPGDGTAAISHEEQQREVVQAVLKLLTSLG